MSRRSTSTPQFFSLMHDRAVATSSSPRMIPFFTLLFALGYSSSIPVVIPIVSGNSDPYLAGKNLAAMVAQSSGVDHSVLAGPFCDLSMEAAAALEHEVFATSAFCLSSASLRRGNGSASCAASGVAADNNPYCIIARHGIDDDGATRWPPEHVSALSCRSFSGLFLLTGLCSLAALSYSIISFSWWWCHRRSRGRGHERDEELGREVAAPRRYLYGEVAAATGNFAESGRIGRGGFGAVYRGFFPSDGDGAGGRRFAVKVLSPESAEQGRREFEAEVRIVGRLSHRNLVRLLGWCDDRRRGLFLVYELVPEGSLDRHLHSPDRLLNWSERYTIAMDLGSAILYLHTECERCVVHGDIKPSNVLLDASRRAKLGDFGTARLLDHGAEPQTTQVVAGTVGYIDPEFVATRRPSTESDVYSYGVVLLEIACGKRPTVAASGQPAGNNAPAPAPALLRRVRDLFDRSTVLDAADQRLGGEFDREQMERVLVTGLWCAHRDRSQRPSIAQAMAALRSEGTGLPELHGVGARRIRELEEQAYRDLSGEASPSTRSSAPATAYHTPEDSCHLHTEEPAL